MNQGGNSSQFVIFRLGDEEYGANVLQVKEIIVVPEMTAVPAAPSHIAGVINLRGQIIAVIDLLQRLGLSRGSEGAPEHVMVVESEIQMVGMIVDEVPEVLTIPETDIQDAPKWVETSINADYILGISHVKDRLIILLDLIKILDTEDVESLAVPASPLGLSPQET